MEIWGYYGVFPNGADQTAPFWGIKGILSVSGSYSPSGVITPDTYTPTTPATVTITCAAIFTLQYGWEKKEGGQWVTIVGESGKTIDVSYPLGSHGAYEYRCKLTGWAGTTYTAPITITVTEPVPIISINADTTIINIGQTATLTAVVMPRPEYAKLIEWQQSADGITWLKVGEGDKYLYTSEAAGVTRFRAAAVGYAETTLSNIIEITTRNPPTVTISADKTEITTLETATLTATATYYHSIEWQMNRGGDVWQVISGATRTTLVFGSEYAGDYRIRAKVTGDGGIAVSDAIEITVSYPAPVIEIYADKESTIVGEPVTFTAEALYALSIEWVKSTDRVSWLVVAEGDSYVFTPEESGTYYIRGDAIGHGVTTESNVITIEVTAPEPPEP